MLLSLGCFTANALLIKHLTVVRSVDFWLTVSVRFGVAGSADGVSEIGLGDKGFATGSPPRGRRARLDQAASARGIARDRRRARAPICEFDYRIGRP